MTNNYAEHVASAEKIFTESLHAVATNQDTSTIHRPVLLELCDALLKDKEHGAAIISLRAVNSTTRDATLDLLYDAMEADDNPTSVVLSNYHTILAIVSLTNNNIGGAKYHVDMALDFDDRWDNHTKSGWNRLANLIDNSFADLGRTIFNNIASDIRDMAKPQ